MRRPISWTAKTPEGKKEYRVTVTADSVKWQVLMPKAEKWDYDYLPDDEDWELLQEKIENLIQRGRFFQAELDAVKRRGAKRK